MGRRLPVLAVALAGVLLLAGCSDQQPDATPSATAAAASPSPSPSVAATSTPSAPPTPATPSPEPSTVAPPSPTPVAAPDVALRTVVSGLDAPLHALPFDGTTLVVQQDGRVLELAADGTTSPWLDLTDRVAFGGEQGLLGLDVLHEETHVVVHYSAREDGGTRLATLPLVDGRPDPDGLTVVLEVDQPAANHNGGSVLAAPDGTVLLGLGDGGAADDRFGNGQDPTTLLGTVLRLDLSDPSRVAVPADNPYADGGAGAPLVWLHGLRNPYRLAIGGGQLHIGDVGQDAVEEVTVVPLDPVARNLGWPVVEGDRCLRDAGCDTGGLEPADVTWTHEQTGACSAITGLVYAGKALPALAGHLLYGDLCAGFLRTVRAVDGEVVEGFELDVAADGLRSIGEGADGEALLLFSDGRVDRLVVAG